MRPAELERAARVAREAASRAGALVQDRLERGFTVQNKGTYDLVTDCDRSSEELVVGMLSEAFPEHTVVAEEGSGSQRAAGVPCWYVDPLDGTTNFAHRLPIFSVSIALEVQGRLELGVVNVPALGWMFSARRGAGARVNGKRMHVSDTPDLSRALVGTGFPYDRRTSADNNVQRLSRVLPEVQGIRRLGSAALDCALVAWGRLDAYWEVKINAWDVAAGALMVMEAGGRVTGLDGGPLDLAARNIVCSNGKVHAPLVKLLQGT